MATLAMGDFPNILPPWSDDGAVGPEAIETTLCNLALNTIKIF